MEQKERDEKRLKEKLHREQMEKEKLEKEELKKKLKKEATEKAVEAMMMQLEEQSFNHSESQSNNSKADLGIVFDKPVNYTMISSLPSKPDEIQSKTVLCYNSKEVNQLFGDTHGLKMLFSNGSI